MKNLWITTALVTCYFFSSTAVLAQELGEFCWKEADSLCVLRLNATQHNNFYSFIGNEICPDEETLTHVNGSGFISDNQVKIGLTFISQFNFLPAVSVTTTYGLAGTINLPDLSFSGVTTFTENVPQHTNYVSAVCDSQQGERWGIRIIA